MSDRTPRAWRLLRRTAVALVALVVLFIALSAAGTFDPQPLGSLRQTDQPGGHDLPGAGEAFIPQPAPWPANGPPQRFSVRLTAAHAGGETDSGYGLALAGKEARLVVAVSPLGYVTVREETGGERRDQLPWQPWPHVRLAEDRNEIWLDVANDDTGAHITAWINREQLWQGAVGWSPSEIELWLGSFGGPASVDFSALEWFAAVEQD